MTGLAPRSTISARKPSPSYPLSPMRADIGGASFKRPALRQSAAQVFHCDRHLSPSSALNPSASLERAFIVETAPSPHLEAMKPLPPLFTVQHIGDRWLVVAPSEYTFTRTLERRELRLGDAAPVLLEEPGAGGQRSAPILHCRH